MLRRKRLEMITSWEYFPSTKRHFSQYRTGRTTKIVSLAPLPNHGSCILQCWHDIISFGIFFRRHTSRGKKRSNGEPKQLIGEIHPRANPKMMHREDACLFRTVYPLTLNIQEYISPPPIPKDIRCRIQRQLSVLCCKL